MNEGQLLLLWPAGEVRRKREGDFGQIGPALLAGTNNCPSFINKISSTSYSEDTKISVRFRFQRTQNGVGPNWWLSSPQLWLNQRQGRYYTYLRTSTYPRSLINECFVTFGDRYNIRKQWNEIGDY